MEKCPVWDILLRMGQLEFEGEYFNIKFLKIDSFGSYNTYPWYH